MAILWWALALPIGFFGIAFFYGMVMAYNREIEGFREYGRAGSAATAAMAVIAAIMICVWQVWPQIGSRALQGVLMILVLLLIVEFAYLARFLLYWRPPD